MPPWVTAAMLMTVSCSPGDGPTTPPTAPPFSPLVDSIRIESDSVEMAVGDTVELRAAVWTRVVSIPEAPLDFVPQWLASDTNVATLGSLDGSLTGVLVEARGVGSTTVVASLGQEADTAIVIVR